MTIVNESEKNGVADAIIREVPVGKGLAGALKLLKERGTFKQSVGTDEFGRTMTPKEDFRRLSHRFHGKFPGKRKQEKLQKQYQQELKSKKLENSDTSSLFAERMREAQALLKMPYLIL